MATELKMPALSPTMTASFVPAFSNADSTMSGAGLVVSTQYSFISALPRQRDVEVLARQALRSVEVVRLADVSVVAKHLPPRSEHRGALGDRLVAVVRRAPRTTLAAHPPEPHDTSPRKALSASAIVAGRSSDPGESNIITENAAAAMAREKEPAGLLVLPVERSARP